MDNKSYKFYTNESPLKNLKKYRIPNLEKQ